MNEIEIDVTTTYVEQESDLTEGRYVFAYTITIKNNGDKSAQLMNRHWFITDGEGSCQEVHGPGVVGQQPMIKPGEAFRYTSGAVIETVFATMEGYYEFRDESGLEVRVQIPLFTLSLPNAIH